ncbi:hypothetical protein J4526_07065 [Desulfurococcaceae archaeon MEX13E-LK6-19]|nr:hypothetical protein J4526_07065 [Desulfurococcaceae archaeon MEX13E-LK6-19]
MSENSKRNRMKVLAIVLLFILSIGFSVYVTHQLMVKEFSRNGFIKSLARASLVPIRDDLADIIKSLKEGNETLFNASVDKLAADLEYLEYYGEYLSLLGKENKIHDIVRLLNETARLLKIHGFEKIRTKYLTDEEFREALETVYSDFWDRANFVTTVGDDFYNDDLYIEHLRELLSEI